MEDILQTPREQLLPFFEDIHPLHRELETGEIEPDVFLRRMSEELGRSETIELNQVRGIYGTSFSRMEETIQTIDEFRPEIRVIMLSNTNAIDIPYIEEQFGLVSWADDAILSYQVGMRKPDLEIYDYAIDEYELDTEQTVFIDDKSENIDTARKAGLRAEIYQSAAQVRELLKKLA
ncbi:MAG: HAD-IA family hydrolase [Candidatus Marinimicrobia bacterium]|nr:HAD-IA family hydrolase [Candidatus Neomarinimicrobiota bacterium]MCF7828832.1 HAD-IA family hydrolase [Candidatus Neomarinimicrobiota bacterium]MCF7880749.1 HAD-IA family hydrolase [Candidatus Neomarinimicrobiota bacterium]